MAVAPGRRAPPVRPPVQSVLVPGLGLDERSSRRLRGRVPATVVTLPAMGFSEPVPPLEALADRLLDHRAMSRRLRGPPRGRPPPGAGPLNGRAAPGPRVSPPHPPRPGGP